MGHSLDRLVVAGRRSCHSSSGICINMAAYTHDNRVRYVVRYLYDIDNNGVLDKNDFKCLAVRNTILEAKGEFPSDRFATNCKIMDDLWNEIALLADFDKNGEVDVDEFKAAVQVNCVNKNTTSSHPCSRPSSRTSSRLLTSTVMAPQDLMSTVRMLSPAVLIPMLKRLTTPSTNSLVILIRQLVASPLPATRNSTHSSSVPKKRAPTCSCLDHLRSCKK